MDKVEKKLNSHDIFLHRLSVLNSIDIRSVFSEIKHAGRTNKTLTIVLHFMHFVKKNHKNNEKRVPLLLT